MGKTVRRVMLDSLSAVGRNENWFADMSRKGLHLKKFGRVFIYFEKGEPKDMRYRMDFLPQQPSQEQLAFYEESGWKLVARNGEFHIFSAEESDNIRELHTDPVEQGHTFEALDKQLKRNTVIFSVALVLILGMLFGVYFLQDEPVLLMVNGQFVQMLLLGVVELYVFGNVLREYLSIRNLKRSLMEGRPIDHREDYKKARFLGGTMALVFNILAICSIVINVVSFARDTEYTLPEETANLPIVRLSEIETSPKLVRETHYIDRGVDFRNRVEVDWNPMAPVQYEVHESGIVPGEMWGDNSGEYSPSMWTRYYQLGFSGLSEALVQDLIHRSIWHEETEILEISYPGVEKVLLAEEGTMKQIFAYAGDRVMHVTYFGKVEIQELIPLAMEELLSYKV